MSPKKYCEVTSPYRRIVSLIYYTALKEKELNKCSAVAEMGDRLATIDMGRKEGAAVLVSFRGELGPHLTQCGLGRDLPPCQMAS